MLFVFSGAAVSEPLMVERNLFARSRKPSSPEPEMMDRNGLREGSLPTWIQLDGIMTHGETRKALVRLKVRPQRRERPKPQPRFLVVHEGDAIEEYTVARINSRSIWLERAGNRYELTLFSKKSRMLAPSSPESGSASTSQGEHRASPLDSQRERAIGSL